MKHTARKIRKPLKNVDSVTRSLFLKAFAWAFSFLGLLGFIMGGIIGVIIAFLISIAASLIALFISNMIADTGGQLFMGRRPIWNIQDQFAASLDQARYHKLNKRFDQALNIVNDVLEEQPDFPDALYLKAQILWEGYGNTEASKGYLKKIMDLIPDENDKMHRWASSLYNQL